MGCVRRAVVQDFGLKPQPSSVRDIFQKQKNAYSPLTGDPRVTELQGRIEKNPLDPAARLELAAAYESYRLFDQALEQYSKAYDLVSSEKAIMGIVRCDQALNRTWQAIPLLEQHLREKPSAVAWNLLGMLYDSSRSSAAAERALREAVAMEPQSDQWRNNLGYNFLLQNKTDAAEIEFRKALELNPKSAMTHNNLGILLARRDDLAGALAEFQFGADAATAHNNLAVVLMEIGNYEASRDALVKALALRRNFSPALENFKLVQDKIKQRADLQKANKLPQGTIRVASAEDAIQSKQPED
jgi:Flp pilus assembly protein TadD